MGNLVILPLTLGTICIAAIGIVRRLCLVGGKIKPTQYLICSFGVATLVFGLVYLSVWGLNIPIVAIGFWRACLACSLVNTWVQFCNVKAGALAKGEVSLTAPIQAMTPGFITFLALTLGEWPGKIGIIGVMLMIVGSYILLWDKTPSRWYEYFGPLKRLLLLCRLKTLSPDERSKTLAVCWSLGSAAGGTLGLLFDSLYVRRAGSLQGIILGSMVLTTILTGTYILMSGRELASQKLSVVGPQMAIQPRWVIGAIFASGVLWVAHVFLIQPTYQATLVAYVGTLKRLSILFAVLGGWLLFRESDIKKRLPAAILIVLGAICISLDGTPARLSTKIQTFGF